MVQGPSQAAIAALHAPASFEEQLRALRQLTDEIVGHEQKKELLVEQNAVETLGNILATATKRGGGKARVTAEASGAAPQRQQQWTPADAVRLQATRLLGSLASGGPAFVPPLCAGGVLTHLVDTLSADTSPRLVSATLHAVRSLVAAAALGCETADTRDSAPLAIFDGVGLEAFHAILKQPSTSAEGSTQLRLVAEIVSLSAIDERTRSLLTTHGFVDTLAALLASHAVANRHVPQSALAAQLPPCPAPSTLPAICSAIASIVMHSQFRTHRFILSQPIRDLFCHIDGDNGPEQRSSFTNRSGSWNVTQPLLPPLHVPHNKTVSFNGVSSSFPTLTSLQSHNALLAGTPGAALGDGIPAVDADHLNAVCSYLIFLARSWQGQDRLVALRLLALVNNAIEDSTPSPSNHSEALRRARERQYQVSLLAVPLAVKLVQAAADSKLTGSETIAEQREAAEIQERSCEVLALLVQSGKELLAAAVNAKVIKHVCSILKKSFDPVALSKPLWSARSSTETQTDTSVPATCKMGARGLPPEIVHVMRCRQSSMQALSALAKEDVHRKAIVDAGVVSCIIDSLKPFPPDFLAHLASTRGQMTPKDGNTTPVILAACHAARSMAGSVSTLRTSIIDAGIAMPMFALLDHSDSEVQVATTDVCCNLLLEFSPMREDLLNAGVIKILTRHARQSEMDLRLSSLWALKHLVLSAPKDIKIQCLEELGTGWLVGAIQGEHGSASLAGHPFTDNVANGGGVSVGLSTPNAAGEQVDLLNPSSMDVDGGPVPADEEENGDEEIGEGGDDDDEDGQMLYDESSSTHYQSSGLRSTLHSHHAHGSTRTASTFSSKRYLSSIKDLETDPMLQAKRSDVAIQKQALDFFRNLLNGDDAASMLDHLLSQIGSDKIFALLTEKLAPISHHPTTTATSNPFPTSAPFVSPTRRPLYNSTGLIDSAMHVLNHIASASPRHKQLLIAQQALLHAWLPHFSHPDQCVRITCVWAVISLTWVEDDSDRGAAKSRGRELRAIGIDEAVRSLGMDPNLDIRERVKTAMRQFEGLL